MQNDLESIESELYQIAKNDTYIKCVCCDDSVKEDYIVNVVGDSYCENCLIDADLIGYKYG